MLKEVLGFKVTHDTPKIMVDSKPQTVYGIREIVKNAVVIKLLEGRNFGYAVILTEQNEKRVINLG